MATLSCTDCGKVLKNKGALTSHKKYDCQFATARLVRKSKARKVIPPVLEETGAMQALTPQVKASSVEETQSTGAMQALTPQVEASFVEEIQATGAMQALIPQEEAAPVEEAQATAAAQEPAVQEAIAKITACAIDYGGTQVVEAVDLHKSGVLPSLFKNLTKTPRKAVRLRMTRDVDFFMARKDKKRATYTPCEPSVSQARLLVKLDCIVSRLTTLVAGAETEPEADTDREETTALPAAVTPYQPELKLEERELLRDDTGQVFHLTCRGERHSKQCFFRVADVGRMLGIADLTRTICHSTSAHVLGEDYVRMEMASPPMDYMGGDESSEAEALKRVELYFTYRGLLRSLFTSRKPVARTFMAWAEEVLFAAHLGTPEQREELAAALVGVSVDIVRQFARHVYAFKMAGVYLLLVGTVEDLRESMGLLADLPGDLLVLKWGRTEDLDQRLTDHDRQYGCLDGARMRLVYFAPIDPRYQSRAELDAKESVCEIGTHLTGVTLRGQAKKELVLFSKHDLKVAGKHAFQRIGATYAGCLKGMTEELDKQRTLGEQKDRQLADKDKQIASMQQQNEDRLADKDKQLLDKEKQLESLKSIYQRQLDEQSKQLVDLKVSHQRQLDEQSKQHGSIVKVFERMIGMLQVKAV